MHRHTFLDGILQRRHIIAGDFNYCGKEFKRKLEQGPVDHETDCKCKVYESGRVAADTHTLRQLTRFSEREIGGGTGLHRKTIRVFWHGGTVTRRTYQKIVNFLRGENTKGGNMHPVPVKTCRARTQGLG